MTQSGEIPSGCPWSLGNLPDRENNSILLPKSGVKMFYRELRPSVPGNNGAYHPLLMLHGFPSSSHQYRNIMPHIAGTFHVIAPDLPGFGFTETPPDFKFTFGNLTTILAEFLDELAISIFNIYIFDYGAPVGLRLALQRPEAIHSIITQNGNAYVEGFGEVWAPIKEFWASENTPDDRAKIAQAMLTFDITKFQYENGTPALAKIAPEAYYLDYALMERPGNKDIQLDLFMDYQHNVAMYEDFHRYFRESQVPLLAIWGKNDVFFIPPGAEAFKKDLPNAQVKLIDAGHFAAESHSETIAQEIMKFLLEVVYPIPR
ncbi:uncharacterized protein N7482_006047 [Penicillium canariense]|uniref:AB hydrolase-1 domain-containing protein n=1 Tax=Penicillium canariense TaxID=189055 RepID=A0A9W9I588_9EURO|nr:uncharacterized protein N7482_006047 [Penicillium canariense]KAJ5167266.1 hypothetical protein N7482_006047 [Penicillium canariense]